MANIEKNLRLEYDSVILSFVNSQLLNRTKEIAKTRYPAQTLDRVTYCLINQIIENLERGLR